ncbi:lactonase family protein [Enterococcus sp. LJL98]
MKHKMLLGTYTRRESEGIYSLELDTQAKTLSGLTLVQKEESPTYLAESQKQAIYTVTSIDGRGGAAAYDKDWRFLNAVTEEGAPLCHLAVDEARQLVYGANYHKGQVTVYKIQADGSLAAADTVFHQEETGPHANQDRPHVHYTGLTPDGRLVVCDLGTDGVYTYDVSDEGKLTRVALFEALPGTGPRHLVFHPNGKYAYVFGELANTITVLAYNAEIGAFHSLQTISTIPADFTEFSGGAAIRISTDGRFLYASNRGHNSLAVFEVFEEGTHIDLIQLISTEGDHPRDFDLDPTEQFVVCANQNTDNLTLYERDFDKGTLTMLQKDRYAPECVCILF